MRPSGKEIAQLPIYLSMYLKRKVGRSTTRAAIGTNIVFVYCVSLLDRLMHTEGGRNKGNYKALRVKSVLGNHVAGEKYGT